MKTKYKVIQIDGMVTEGSVDWPKAPDFAQIKALIEPLIQTPGKPYAYLEHVRVWDKGSYVSMFVDDMGAIQGLPVNKLATVAYHANVLENSPQDADLGNLPKVYGPAVLFSRNVWF